MNLFEFNVILETQRYYKLIHSTIQRSKLLSNTKKIFDFENKRNKRITEA